MTSVEILLLKVISDESMMAASESKTKMAAKVRSDVGLSDLVSDATEGLLLEQIQVGGQEPGVPGSWVQSCRWCGVL